MIYKKSKIKDIRHAMGYSIGLTGKIESQDHIDQFTSCSCKLIEEHKAKWESYEKDYPPQPLDFETIKSRYNINEKYLTFILNRICISPSGRCGHKNNAKKMRGRPVGLYLPKKKYEMIEELEKCI